MRKLFQLFALCALALQMFVAGSAHAASTTIITTPNGMTPDQHYFSPNGRYFAVFQGFDGNLVVYKGSDRTAAGVLWASGARQGTVAVMQYDSNFVIYRGAITPANAVWHTKTNNSANTGGSVTISDDGALRVLNGSGTQVWSSGIDPALVPPPPPCVRSSYPVCVNPGSPFQYTSTVWACSYSEAQAAAWLYGGGSRLGACY